MLSGPSCACGEAGFDGVLISLAVLPDVINRKQRKIDLM